MGVEEIKILRWMSEVTRKDRIPNKKREYLRPLCNIILFFK